MEVQQMKAQAKEERARKLVIPAAQSIIYDAFKTMMFHAGRAG